MLHATEHRLDVICLCIHAGETSAGLCYSHTSSTY